MDIAAFEKQLKELGINIANKWQKQPCAVNYFEFFINKKHCLASISNLETFNYCVFTCNGELLYVGYSAIDCLKEIEIFNKKYKGKRKKI